MRFIRNAAEFLLYSNIFIGFCAVALALTNQLTVEGEIHLNRTYYFVFFSTMFTYSYMKFWSSEGSEIITRHRNWAKENPQLSKNMLLISLIATVYFFLFLLDWSMMLTVAILAIFTAFYSTVNIPFLHPPKKLRDFGLLKTLFVAMVWSVTTVIVPLSGSHVETDMLLFLLLRRFLFIVALTMVFEIKDMQGDKQFNLYTLPHVIGMSNTKLLAQAILFALMVINAVQYFFFDISLSNMLAVNLSLIISILCIQPVNEETREIWYYLVLDGMMLLQFVFVYLAVRWI